MACPTAQVSRTPVSRAPIVRVTAARSSAPHQAWRKNNRPSSAKQNKQPSLLDPSTAHSLSQMDKSIPCRKFTPSVFDPLSTFSKEDEEKETESN